jgi:hypothetical protein
MELFILALYYMQLANSKLSLFLIAGVILASLKSRLEFIRRQLAAVDGVFWRGDHTYQAASRIRSAAGSKDFAAIYSIMNEWGQIVAQWAVGDSSFDEYVRGLQGVVKRYEDLGFMVRMASPLFSSKYVLFLVLEVELPVFTSSLILS